MSELKPFFTYFGGKWRVAKHYPPPRYKTIIESFAGSAGYALRYQESQVILCEVYPLLTQLWKWLISVPAAEIRALPIEIEHVNKLDVCIEAKWLIGFWLNKGTSIPRKSPSAWCRSGERPNSYWGHVIRERIAGQVESIRHWTVHEGSYDTIQNQEATWFVDPPYQGASGSSYVHNAVDYAALALWCKSRSGQVIVCEQEGANWLPFVPFRTLRIMNRLDNIGLSSELMWTEDCTREI